ncbi:MAG: ferredoxin [Kineosporiaceae bacterium]|nr:ferredoxin [Kineosporiaceae bacterium]MBK7621919.1 ferredoxin [Kineosporiaceae bacterium]MBK8074233.1 ferredoxin [Kineosporiaceae bacterium]
MTAARMIIDPISCRGVGLCAHLAERLIRLDRWGYPIVSAEPPAPADERRARAAERACPHRAVRVEQDDLPVPLEE